MRRFVLWDIVFKSCKLVAVMLGSTVILNKSYSVIEYVIALGLVVGMMSFAFADRAGTATGASSEADQSSIVGARRERVRVDGLVGRNQP